MRTSIRLACFFTLFFALPQAAALNTLQYSATLTHCTASCESIGGIGPGSNSTVNLYVGLPDGGGAGDYVFEAGTVEFEVRFLNPFGSYENTEFGTGPDCDPSSDIFAICNPATANPLRIFPSAANILGTATVAADGTVAGVITLHFTADPFARNGGTFTMDLGTGEAALAILDGAVTVATYAGSAIVDTDTDVDGVLDGLDNCLLQGNPSQLDTDQDGHGNACDADFNDDCIVNAIDLGIFRTLFFQPNNEADLNGDGIVAVIDLGIFRTLFFTAPGPSPNGICTEQTNAEHNLIRAKPRHATNMAATPVDR